MLTPYYIDYNSMLYTCMLNIEDKDYLKIFAHKVRPIREQQGLSQEKLAERAGLHRTYIGMVERLERNPSLVCIYKIANGLGVHVSQLFI